jgi:hypothetical protein
MPCRRRFSEQQHAHCRPSHRGTWGFRNLNWMIHHCCVCSASSAATRVHGYNGSNLWGWQCCWASFGWCFHGSCLLAMVVSLPVFCSGLANTFKFLHQSTHWCSINRCYPALIQDAVNSTTFESSTARESLADGLQRNLLDHGSHNLLPSRHGMGRYYQSLELGFCNRRISSLPCTDFCLHIE